MIELARVRPRVAPGPDKAGATANCLALEQRLFTVLVELAQLGHICEKGITGEAMTAVRQVLRGATTPANCPALDGARLAND